MDAINNATTQAALNRQSISAAMTQIALQSEQQKADALISAVQSAAPQPSSTSEGVGAKLDRRV